MCIGVKIGIGIVLLLALLSLTACNTATIASYQHEQSEIFYKNFDIESAEVSNFKFNEVLFTVDVNKVTHSSYAIWLGLYSHKAGKFINIERAVIVGESWKEERSFNQELIIDSAVSDYDLFKLDSGLKLFEMSKSDSGKLLLQDQELHLTVFFDVGGRIESITFVLKEKIEKQVVFPT
ncbi:hypothetical protein [Aliidiomarina celeris]|uniref:hypothetical protein n=1 Tax=Aliidiomarina celeris TaxID=2249428 RepID=UPI000DE86F6B|nr:hypothetical protein [Aliidiomarina celeris]